MGRSVLGATALAVGRDDDRRRPRSVRSESIRGRADGAGGAWIDCEHFSLGGAEGIGNALYGVAKAATDKLTNDLAVELRPHGVSVVSLYPGLVRTEAVLAAGIFDLSNSESPEYIGRAVGALSTDPELLSLSGRVLIAAELGQRYGFADIDGQSPRALSLQDV